MLLFVLFGNFVNFVQLRVREFWKFNFCFQEVRCGSILKSYFAAGKKVIMLKC